MKTNRKPTRIIGRKKYPDYDKQDMDNLARARRWLGAAPPKPTARYRSRFTHGDSLGRHLSACTG